ncbi:MAG: hypothetical protein P8P74_03745 [Crocinitomicaceae bacterium]|nr:hypothetical protein [Crocinitomicaceae bacterium]
MSKEPSNIDRLVREKLNGFEMTPPPSVWENTSASLQSGRKKRFFIWFIFGIAALALLGTGIYFYSSNTTSNEQLLAANADNQTSQSSKNDSGEDKAGSNSNNNDNNTTSQRDTDSQNPADSQDELSREDLNGKSDLSSLDLDKQQSTFSASRYQQGSDKQSEKDKSSPRSGSDLGDNSKRDARDLSTDSKGTGSQAPDSFKGNDSPGDAKPNPSLPLQNGNDASAGNSNDKSEKTVEYSELPLYDLGLLNTLNTKSALADLDKGSFSNIAPKQQLFSLEGSIGASTFKNKPNEKTTDPQLFSILNNAASNRQSFDVRLGLNYHLTNRISLQTGVHYTSSSEDYTYESEEITTLSYVDTVSFTVDSVTMDTTFNINTFYYDTTIIVANNQRNTYKLFSLPFQFAWSQPISPRSSLEFAMGGELSLFGNNTGTTILNDSTTVLASSAYRTSGMLSIGGSIKYLYHFGNRHAVYVEPWAQFGLTNNNTPQLNYTSLRRRVGIRFGYRFYF